MFSSFLKERSRIGNNDCGTCDLCCFRLAFIWVYAPDKGFNGCRKKWYECFRYGFWWGMDYNAYVFLISWLGISLPGAFFERYFEIGDSMRVIFITIYAAILYFAFMGKMIFIIISRIFIIRS